jgi:hypothetical protein
MPTGNTKLMFSRMIKMKQTYLFASARADLASGCVVALRHKSHSIATRIFSSAPLSFTTRFFSPSRMRLVSSILFVAACALGRICPQLHSQVTPAASRPIDLQLGATFNLGSSDYTAPILRGFGFYTTLDFRRHFGIEGEFHQLDDPNAAQGIYERTYEVGPRYVRHYGPLAPYAKFMIGRGVFNFPPSPGNPAGGSVANLAYNMWAGGLGADYRIRPSIKLRVEYEFQRWGSFPPNGLSPRVFSLGVAYHFH